MTQRKKCDDFWLSGVKSFQTIYNMNDFAAIIFSRYYTLNDLADFDVLCRFQASYMTLCHATQRYVAKQSAYESWSSKDEVGAANNSNMYWTFFMMVQQLRYDDEHILIDKIPMLAGPNRALVLPSKTTIWKRGYYANIVAQCIFSRHKSNWAHSYMSTNSKRLHDKK